MFRIRFIIKGYNGKMLNTLAESNYPSAILHFMDDYRDYILRMGYSISVWARLPNGKEILLDAGSESSGYDEADMEAKVSAAIKHP